MSGSISSTDAEQRLQAIGRLVSLVAHDINNLLGVISNSAHLMQRQASTPDLQLPLAATLRAVDAGSQLTRHLLRLAGGRPLRPQAVDLAREGPALQAQMRSLLGRHVELALQVAPDTRAAWVDIGELELDLIDMALRAVQAHRAPTGLGSTPGPCIVQLQVRNAQPDEIEGQESGACVRITVSNQGADPSQGASVLRPAATVTPRPQA